MKNLTLGDFCPTKNAPPSLDQCIFDLRATQTENEHLRDEIDRLNRNSDEEKRREKRNFQDDL